MLSTQIGGIAQWVQRANGTWISEKNPGYPFFAAPFQLIGALRVAPLFYGALGCTGLYLGARRWLGRFGGTWAVALYCSSGAALVFTWRATMPTFTDASLIAAGTGLLLWTLLAADAPAPRRTLAGLLAFLAFEGATFIRYTNVVVLLVAVAAVLVALKAAAVPGRSMLVWFGSVTVFGGAAAAFDSAYYGGATKTGYVSGEITFSLGAVTSNLTHMPAHLVASMPLITVALAAVVWTAVRLIRRGDALRSPGAGRDAAVVVVLTASWVAVYGLYSAYTWTVSLAPNAGATLQVVRFYLPALGAVSLLAAWVLEQFPRRVPIAVIVSLACVGVLSYGHLAGSGPGGGFGRGPGVGGAPAQSGSLPSLAPSSGSG